MRVLLVTDTLEAREQIQNVLESADHTVLESSDLGAGASLASTAWDVDAVIAGVFLERSTERQAATILVEIGVALGRGLPVLLLTREGTRIPALAGVPRIDASLRDPETLALKVDLFLQAVSVGAPRKPAQRPDHGPERRSMIRNDGFTSELERKVADLFVSNGSILLSDFQAAPNEGRPDLALYLEGLESDVGLVLVEVKSTSSLNSHNGLRAASRQLSKHVASANATLGLIVFDGPLSEPRVRLDEPFVASVSFRQLSRQLAIRPLEDVIRRLRNESLRGI